MMRKRRKRLRTRRQRPTNSFSRWFELVPCSKDEVSFRFCRRNRMGGGPRSGSSCHGGGPVAREWGCPIVWRDCILPVGCSAGKRCARASSSVLRGRARVHAASLGACVGPTGVLRGRTVGVGGGLGSGRRGNGSGVSPHAHPRGNLCRCSGSEARGGTPPSIPLSSTDITCVQAWSIELGRVHVLSLRARCIVGGPGILVGAVVSPMVCGRTRGGVGRRGRTQSASSGGALPE